MTKEKKVKAWAPPAGNGERKHGIYSEGPSGPNRGDKTANKTRGPQVREQPEDADALEEEPQERSGW